jgi:hypothetical protein
MLTFPPNPAVGDEHIEHGNAWTWNAKSVWERGVGPEPVLVSLVPDNAYVTLDLPKQVDINGTGFQLNSRIYFDNVAVVGGYVSSAVMRMTVNGVNELTPRDAPVRVDRSNELPFHFLPRPPDSPSITYVIPDIIWTMNPAATMRVQGTGFETVSTVMLQEPPPNNTVTAQTTTFVSAEELTIWFDGPNAQTGVWQVYVNTPGADAPDSNKVTVTVSA